MSCYAEHLPLGGAVFKKIVVALDHRPESHRALSSAIDLANALKASLATLSMMEEMPGYASYAIAVDPNTSAEWNDEQRTAQRLVHEKAKEQAQASGLEITSHILEEHEVHAIVRFLKEHQADLLVVGLHHRQPYIARLWNAIFELAQDAPCSILGVH
jgi:nucleotide-binding universal stress UspA family protein